MARLSKSRIMSSLQCLKRVYLEVNHPQLARFSRSSQAAFALGHQVGELAVRLYGDGSYVEYSGGSLDGALRQTEQLMNSPLPGPVYEATLQHAGVLVREDVLLPDPEGGWRVVEVKASTSVKPEHLHDCAVQAWVHLESGYPLTSISLAHIDREFVYPGDGDYDGLLIENDLSGPVFELLPSVPTWVAKAREAAAGPEPDTPVGQHCSNPYDCPFLEHCWPQDAEYPIMGLGGGRRKLGIWVMNGLRDIRDVPSSDISSETQLRVHRITCEGVPEILSGAKAFADSLSYPRFYLDFETVAPAVPLWANTRPYQVLPFQWSCHIERAPGEMEHQEFIDLSGEAPMRPLAAAMIRALEDSGPVLMYTSYERQVIRGLAGMFPDLEGALRDIDARLVDLHPPTRAYYYHPDMLGSWSIKAVLPTIAPEMDYASLEGIKEGTEASMAYLEAIAPEIGAGQRETTRRNLLRYCRHDTEAMVRLVHFFEDS